MAAKKKRAKPGPEAERLKLPGDWQEAVAKSLGKKRPPEGWPKPDGLHKPRRKRRSTAMEKP